MTGYKQVDLVPIRAATQRTITDQELAEGIGFEVREWRETAFRAMKLEVQGLILAVHREDKPYESDRRVENMTYLKRPVRDGILNQLGRLPGILGRWFDRLTQTETVEVAQITEMTQNHYYSCPHMQIADSSDRWIHFNWLAEKVPVE